MNDTIAVFSKHKKVTCFTDKGKPNLNFMSI